MFDYGNLITLSYILNIILIIIVIFFERKDPVVSITWVMAFILFPIGGFFLYLLLGLGVRKRNSGIHEDKQERDDELAKRLYEQLDYLNTNKIGDTPNLDIIKYFCNHHCLYTDNNEADIIIDAEDKYRRLLEDIENAEESINLLYFIFRKDEIGRKIMNALIEKANAGVEVRFLYDSFGCYFTPKKFLRALNNTKNGQAVSFYPVKLFNLPKINHRNHRKIVVIDKKIAYLGGMNIGDEYMGKKKPTPWRDTHLRITGDAVLPVYKRFCLDWDFSAHDNLSETLSDLHLKGMPNEEKEPLPMQIVSSGPDSLSEEIKSGIIKLIFSAKEYLYIQTPYFVPDQTFQNALLTAAASGVDVRLMIPGKPDKSYVYYTSLSYLDNMLKAGVKVYLTDGFIHSKTIVADDRIATIGTTNIDIRSFQLHFEINAFFYSDSFAKRCREIFESDIESSRLLTYDEYKKRPLGVKIKESFFRLFSPIL